MSAPLAPIGIPCSTRPRWKTLHELIGGKIHHWSPGLPNTTPFHAHRADVIISITNMRYSEMQSDAAGRDHYFDQISEMIGSRDATQLIHSMQDFLSSLRFSELRPPRERSL